MLRKISALAAAKQAAQQANNTPVPAPVAPQALNNTPVAPVGPQVKQSMFKQLAQQPAVKLTPTPKAELPKVVERKEAPAAVERKPEAPKAVERKPEAPKAVERKPDAIDAKAKAELEAKTKAEIAAKAKAELEAKAKAELAAKAKAQAEFDKAQAEFDKAQAEFDKAKAEIAAKAKAEAEVAKAKRAADPAAQQPAPILNQKPLHAAATTETAICSDYRNNSGLHAIFHTFMGFKNNPAITPDKWAEHFKNHPIFDQFNKNFCLYYGLEHTEDNVRAVVTLLQTPNPIDLEVICGQVLRSTLSEIVMNDPTKANLLKELDDDQPLSEKALALLANAMGGTLEVTSKAGVETFKVNSALWNVRLVREGDHYNFNFPKVTDNIAFNNRRKGDFNFKEMLNFDIDAKLDQTGALREQMDAYIIKQVQNLIVHIKKQHAVQKNGM